MTTTGSLSGSLFQEQAKKISGKETHVKVSENELFCTPKRKIMFLIL